MQYWDEILYPRFLNIIRGENYIILSDKELEEDLQNLTLRAIASFKFSRIQLSFSHEELLNDESEKICRYYFLNEIGNNEIEVLLSFMKAYWAENMISNSDSFNQLYYDKDIKTYSPSAALQQGISMMNTFKKNAKEALMWYSRETETGFSSLGEINE